MATKRYNKDPLVDLGGSGPSTLQPGIYTSGPLGEVEFVGQVPDFSNLNLTDGLAPPSSPQSTVRPGVVTDLREGQYGFVGQVPDYTDVPLTPEAAEEQEREQRQSQYPYLGGDEARLQSALQQQSAQSAQQQTDGSAANHAAASGRLQDILDGIAADSSTIFDTLIREAGARGEATSQSVADLTDRFDQRLAGTGAAVAGEADGAGGLSGQVLSESATAGSQGVRDIQSALGGFLAESQLRRSNATQDYLAGLQGQSQITMDRARTLGEYTLAQQRAIAEQERVRSQEDIAANTAADQITQNLLGGMDLGTFNALPDEVQDLYIDRLGANQEQMQATPGAIEQILSESGISETVVPGLSQLELKGRQFFEQQGPTLEDGSPNPYVDSEGAPTLGGIERWLRDNVVIVPPGDKRLGRFTKTGQSSGDGLSMGQKLAITQEDFNRYLQAASTGAL